MTSVKPEPSCAGRIGGGRTALVVSMMTMASSVGPLNCQLTQSRSELLLAETLWKMPSFKIVYFTF